MVICSAVRVGRDGTEDGLPAVGLARNRDAGTGLTGCEHISLSAGYWGQGTAGAVRLWSRKRSTALRAAYRLALDDADGGS